MSKRCRKHVLSLSKVRPACRAADRTDDTDSSPYNGADFVLLFVPVIVVNMLVLIALEHSFAPANWIFALHPKQTSHLAVPPPDARNGLAELSPVLQPLTHEISSAAL